MPRLKDTPNQFEVQILNEIGEPIKVITFQRRARSVSFYGGYLPERVLIATETKTFESGQYVDDSGCVLDFYGNPLVSG